MKTFHPLTVPSTGCRDEDAWGAGWFGAPRGERRHCGVDVQVSAGAEVLSPVDGEVVREAPPYDDDPRYSGLLIAGRGEWAGYEVKLFYVAGRRLGPVRAGDVVGHAQDISLRYPGITNHVHLELRQGDRLLDPTRFLPRQG